MPWWSGAESSQEKTMEEEVDEMYANVKSAIPEDEHKSILRHIIAARRLDAERKAVCKYLGEGMWLYPSATVALKHFLGHVYVYFKPDFTNWRGSNGQTTVQILEETEGERTSLEMSELM